MLKSSAILLTIFNMALSTLYLNYNKEQPTLTFNAYYNSLDIDNNFSYYTLINMELLHNNFNIDIAVMEYPTEKETNYYKIVGDGYTITKKTHQHYLLFDNFDVFKGKRPVFRLGEYRNEINNILNSANPVQVVSETDDFIVMKFFFHGGQILAFKKG
ncbi:hypothetical protein [Vibrio paracholerae]|uniref:hypothetical protein n=1 Tax=Vibrio paracholerae TaxID=650003 RepID=UPI001FD227C7|nr:hypothetical protein [Vibrio paracholerae]